MRINISTSRINVKHDYRQKIHDLLNLYLTIIYLINNLFIFQHNYFNCLPM